MSKKLILGVSLIITLWACSSFSYTHYILAPDKDGELKGVLQGKEPKDDLSISVCSPDDHQKGKCVALMIDEYEKMLSDIASLQEQLKSCQAGK